MRGWQQARAAAMPAVMRLRLRRARDEAVELSLGEPVQDIGARAKVEVELDMGELLGEVSLGLFDLAGTYVVALTVICMGLLAATPLRVAHLTHGVEMGARLVKGVGLYLYDGCVAIVRSQMDRFVEEDEYEDERTEEEEDEVEEKREELSKSPLNALADAASGT